MTVTYNCTTWLYGNCQFTFLVTWFYRWIGALWSDLCFLHVGLDHIPNLSIRVSESRAAGRIWNFLFEWNKCIILAQHDMKWILPGWQGACRQRDEPLLSCLVFSFLFSNGLLFREIPPKISVNRTNANGNQYYGIKRRNIFCQNLQIQCIPRKVYIYG